ncbi:hypothetical protein E2C01_061203 [Portunus trituberculatus]|uniref:Uncharacterized protein n=1 Tax=Portunus trituberculatus TaxID=210409 RepID=A0A5B7HA37_PORTR|nr:hypothetical protein [Portunus trituberculatus]
MRETGGGYWREQRGGTGGVREVCGVFPCLAHRLPFQARILIFFLITTSKGHAEELLGFSVQATSEL